MRPLPWRHSAASRRRTPSVQRASCGLDCGRGHHLEREFKFPDFNNALDFTNRVGALAESEGHHPDIYLAWGKVGIKIWTHKIDGLTESDFVLAAKIDRLRET